MADRIILRRTYKNSVWKWKVKVRTKNREIPLNKVTDPASPPTATPAKLEVLHVNIDGTTNPIFYIKFIGTDYGISGATGVFWYKIPKIMVGEFKIRLQNGITMVRDMTGGAPGGPWLPLEYMPGPPETDDSNLPAVEVHNENPRWVKVGTKWYYIG